jgi:DNA-binding beta-propeller fold protein YncE
MRFLVHAFSLLMVLTTAAAARADKLVLVAGGGTDTENVPATKAKLIAPFGVDFDTGRNMYIVELTGQRVLKVTEDGILTILGGTGRKGGGGDDGPARKAEFNGMHSLAVGRDGFLYLADTWNNRIRRLNPKTGFVSAFAGTGEKGYSGDGGPAIKAQFGGIYSVAFDFPGKRLYVADLDNRRVRVIDMQTGVVSLVAGNGKKGVPEDGADAKASPLVDPRAVAVDRKDNVYILERGGHALRVVDSSGKIRTVIGTGKAGLSGDGGEARKAQLSGPKHLCIDLEDNVIIADSSNHVIRKYLPGEGKIVRIAGTGKKGPSGDGGPPLEVPLNEPHGVTVRADGTLYIVDSNNHRVFRLAK